MADYAEDDGLSPVQEDSGHRVVPHTADVRIEAWGTSREQCLGEAVVGMVECFADLSGARAKSVRQVRFVEASDDDLLAALLEEVVYGLEVYGEVPVDVEAEGVDGGLDVRLAVTSVDTVPVIGAAPKAVSWNELRLAKGPYGWTCAVTIDV